MALPRHLARYDSLIDLLVDELVGEAQEAETKTPAGHDSDGRHSSTRDELPDEHVTMAERSATATRNPPLR
jgi:hypothetical protein